MTWWHGGPKVRTGNELLPPASTGACRSGDNDHQDVVFITPLRSLALTYASTCDGWIYEVLPIGPIRQDPGSMLAPGMSMMCDRAVILRRFKPSRREMESAARSVAEAWRAMEATA